MKTHLNKSVEAPGTYFTAATLIAINTMFPMSCGHFVHLGSVVQYCMLQQTSSLPTPPPGDYCC